MTATVIFEYKSSAQEKEEKEAKAKLKKEEEKRELAQALEVRCETAVNCSEVCSQHRAADRLPQKIAV